MRCPNKNTDEWKALVSQFGETGAYQEWVNNNFDIPTNLSRLVSDERSSDIEYANAIFSDQRDKIKFQVEDHKYVNVRTGVEYKPVSTVKVEHGYGDKLDGDNANTDPYKNHYLLSGLVGTMIHDYINKSITGEQFIEDSNLILSNESKKFLKDLVKLYKANGDIVATEQVISDDSTNIAGTIDLLLKDKNGDLIQLDFKTKIVNTIRPTGEKMLNYDKRSWKYYNKTTNNVSDRLKHDFQQTMYKRMQELLGLDIKYKGIVPIEVIMKQRSDGKTEINEIRLTKLLSLDKRLNYYNLVENSIINPIIDGILNIKKTTVEQSMNIKYLDYISELSNKGLTILKKHSAYLNVIGERYEEQMLNLEIDEIENADNSSLEIFNVVNSSLNLMKPFMENYNKLLNAEKVEGYGVWNLNTLQRWKNFALAFDNVLDEIQVFYQDHPDMFASIEGFNPDQFDTVINEAINIKNTLKMAYKSKGMPQWLDWISRNSKIVEYQDRQKFQNDWKKDFKKKNPNAKLDREAMEAATDAYITKNQSVIREKTKQFIRNQADVAEDDINFVYRWADTIYDTKDPILGAMAKAHYQQLLEMRNAYNNWYTDLGKIMDDFDKKYNTSSFADQQKVYNFMLDYNKGGVPFIVQRIPLSFVEAREEFEESLKVKYPEMTNKEFYEKRNDWLNENAPYVEDHIELVKQDRINIFDSMYNDTSEITEDEYKALIENEEANFVASFKTLAQHGDITGKTASLLYERTRNIPWQYRQPNKKKFPNPNWDAIQKMDENDPKRRLYEFINNYSNIGNVISPDRFKIGYRLPGVRKELMERVVNGQKVSNLIGEKFKDNFTVTSDDTTRGQFEIANEIDQSINFVPVHYTSALTQADQSFDIPNIYKAWYKSVLNYQFTTNILPELEFTKYIINNRKVVKKNKGKQLINSLTNIYNKNNENSEAISSFVTAGTNNLAEQLNDWFQNAIYGKSDRYLGESFGIDHAKVLRSIQSFTSLKIMGVNLLAMVNNASMAEVAQLVEAHAGTLMDKKTYSKATWEYAKYLPDTLADVGARVSKSKVNLALEYFNVFFDMAEKDFRDRSKLKRLFKSSALFATTQLGEHEVQARFLIGHLMSIKVKDNAGKDLGNLWDNLIIEDGKMMINPKVNVTPTELRGQISRKVTQTLREMHGNYTDYSATAMSANGYLSMLQQFRKWIIPGIRRRFDKEYFSEFSEMGKAGYFRTGGKFYYNKFKKNANIMSRFLGKMVDESKALDLAVAADIEMLNDTERAAVRKLNMDMAVFVTMLAIYSILMGWRDDNPDDYRNMSDLEKGMFNNLTYQIYRLRTEQAFYINPADFTRMIQSPMATMSITNSFLSVLGQLTTAPTEKYKAGEHKGDSKLYWKLYNQLPVVRQLYRVSHADESLSALVNPMSF